MTSSTWRSLLQEKYRLSLRLFLLLNVISAMFSMASPLYNVQRVPPAVLAIFFLSTGLLIYNGLLINKKINIRFIAVIFGSLWSWQIYIKAGLIPGDDSTYLMIALLSVLFIGAIAFTNNISAFVLHSLPVFCMVMWLDRGEHLLQGLYSLLLPITGISIQHVIHKRSDNFAQGLMFQLMEEKETLSDLSMLDPLTGLYNRRGFQYRFDNIVTVDAGNHYVLLLDIDHFKAYNDNYGHMMGDQALIRVSAAIRDVVRSRDIVTRYGGEEFMVFLTSSSPELAKQAAERIRQRVYDLCIPHMFNDCVATNVTVSIGLSPLREAGIDEALRNADAALYEAKSQGRNNILVSDEPQVA